MKVEGDKVWQMDEQKNRTEFKYTDDGNMSYLFNNDSKPNQWLLNKLDEPSAQLDSGNLSFSNIDDTLFYQGELGAYQTTSSSSSSSSGSSSSGQRHICSHGNHNPINHLVHLVPVHQFKFNKSRFS